MQNSKDLKDVPKWLWLFLPCFLWICPYILRLINEELFKKIIREELGLMELSTVFFLLTGFILSVLIFKELKDFKYKWFRFLVLFLGLACFIFAGEESSWGQHYFRWQSPQAFQKKNIFHNKQHETNFHNSKNKKIRFIFKDLPRFSLQTMALFLGIIIPLMIYIKKTNLDKNKIFYWLCGTYVCLPSAILSFLVDYPERVIFFKKYFFEIKKYHLPTPEMFKTHTLESKECFLALFLMVYLASIYVRTQTSEKKQYGL